jgi:hypothetical protein
MDAAAVVELVVMVEAHARPGPPNRVLLAPSHATRAARVFATPPHCVFDGTGSSLHPRRD